MMMIFCALRAKGRGRGSLLFICALLALFACLGQAQNPGAIVRGLPPGGVGAACLTGYIGYLMPVTGGERIILCDPVAHLWTAQGAGTVTSVSGTTNEIDVATGTTTPVISVAAAILNDTIAACSDVGSSENLYACSTPVAIPYVTNGRYRFKANTANTAAASINFDAQGGKTIVKVAGGITTALAANDIRAGQVVELAYDGTNMQMQSTLGNASAGASPAGSPGCVQLTDGVSAFGSACGLTGGAGALIGAQAVPNLGPGSGEQYQVALIVQQNYNSDPLLNEGAGVGQYVVVTSDAPDSTLYELDGTDAVAAYTGTGTPPHSLILVGVSGYALVGNPFDYSGPAPQARSASVKLENGGYFIAGIHKGDNTDLPEARGAFFSVDNLNQYTGGGTGHINTGKIVYIHNGAHNNIDNLYGIYLDDLTGATVNEGIHSLMTSGTGKYFINHVGTAPSFFGGSITSLSYSTATNCADSAGAAACGSAAAGMFVIDAGATTVVVSTTAVTANSEIEVWEDSSEGARLGITCNTQSILILGTPVVSGRNDGADFTAKIVVGPTATPMCLGYKIVN